MISLHYRSHITKASLLVFALFFVLLTENAYTQETISIRVENESIRDVIRHIEKKSEYSFFYSENLVFLYNKVSLDVDNKDITEVLRLLLSGTETEFYIFEKQIVIGPGNKRLPFPVSGIILDSATNLPLPGVNVYVEGKPIGVISDNNGYYNIIVPDQEDIVVFSYIGYEKKRIEQRELNNTNIFLVSYFHKIEEAVVLGYGQQESITFTGSVSKVNIDELLKAPASSVQNALAGRATGLMVIQRSGEPGRDFADIYIRGQSTYGNASPMIFIDGVERDFRYLDPNEIQSIHVLKDAASTAVFGMRGANGAIVIVTKEASFNSKPKVSYSSNYGISKALNIPRFLNAAAWTRFYNVASRNDNIHDPNWSQPFSPQKIELYESGIDKVFHPDTDWADMMLADFVPQHQHNFNIQGGGDRIGYFVSLGYFSQTGAYKNAEILDDFPVNSSLERFNIRANTNFRWTNSFSTSVKFATQIAKGNYPAGSNMNEILNNVFTNSPIVSPPIVNGKIISDTPELSQYKIGVNPFFLFFSGGYQINYLSNTSIDLGTTLKLDKFVNGLSFRGKFAYDNFYSQNVTRNRGVDQYEIHRTGEDISKEYYKLVKTVFSSPWYTASQSYNQNYRYYTELALDYQSTLKGGHNLGGLFLGTAESLYRGGSPALPFNYAGLVGRLTYNYRRKYNAEVNLGINGSENFAKGRQYGLFPSYSVGYIMSEEKFFPKSPYLTFLKFRFSNGKVGNDKIGGERFLFLPSSFQLSNSNPQDPVLYRFGENYTPVIGYLEKKIGNPYVSWEVSRKMNFGAEIKLFNDRIFIVHDFFYEKRNGILGNYNRIPFTFGDLTLLPSYNYGRVNNKGYEIELGYNNDPIRKVNFWLNMNYTFARNTIVYFDEISPEYENLVRTGKRINQPFMLIADGLYNTWDEINDPERIPSIWETASPIQPGDIRYVDVNSDGIIDNNDISAVGYSNLPEIVYGISSGLKWKGFELSVHLQGADNVSTYYGNKTIFSSGYGARTEAAYDAWTEEKYVNNETILYPRLSLKNNDTHNTQINSLLLQNARYFRLKNLEIGYAFSGRLMKRIRSESLKVYLNGQNLFTFTPMKYWDPEIIEQSNSQYPVSRIINVGFKSFF